MMPCFIPRHFMNCVMDGIEVVFLGALGKVELAGGGAELALHAPGQVGLGAGLHVRLEVFAEELCELRSVLRLFIGGLLPVQADFGIALAVGNAGHAEIHTDLAALAGKVGLELIENVLLILVADVLVVLDGLGIDAVLVLGGQRHLAGDLLELVRRGMADRAFGGRLLALIDITADGADELFHGSYIPF